jgi:hypothetical protein
MLTVTFDRLQNVAQKYLNDLAFGMSEVAELVAEMFLLVRYIPAL